MKNKSLKTKIIVIASAIGGLVAVIIAITLYLNNVVPLKEKVSKELISNMESFVETQIFQKVQGGIMGATAVAIDPRVAEALAIEERGDLLKRFAKIRDQYKGQTNYKNIQTQLITADGRSLIKSWELDSYGQNLANSPLVQKLINEKQAFGSLAVGALGVSIIAMSPVLEGDEFLGGIAMIQGLASVRKNFTAQTGGEWLLLVDREYISDKYGEMPVIEKNTSFNERFIVANDRWFKEDVINLVKSNYQQTTGINQNIYFHHQKIIIDLPAMDETNQPFGRHIFVMDEKEYYGPINEAMNSALIAIIGIVLGIFLLTTVLVVVFSKIVINPLINMQSSIKKIVSTGNFDIRNSVESEDEIGQTSEALNSLLHQISIIIKDSNIAVKAISEGDFSKIIDGTYAGNLAELQEGINSSVTNIDSVIQQISKVIHAMKVADFNISIENNTKGQFFEILKDSEQAINSTNNIISEINLVMESMQKGDFSLRVSIDASGELNTLKEHINQSMDSLNSAIQEISSVASSMSQGDLTRTVNNEYHGELSALKEAMNLSLEKLGESIGLAISSANIVTSEAEKVSLGADNLNTRLQQQASAVEQTSATMEQMNSAVQNNTETTDSVAKVMQKVQGQANEAAQIMKSTIDSMDSIQESSQQISEIVTLIDSISFQTNLLALNAAVEAARAGEHGRGFAVVASEVRSLAQKSADAAKDIKNLIDSSVQRVSQGSVLASQSGDAIKQITASIEEVSNMIYQVNTASHEQAQGIGQVHNAINEIDSATQENAALVEQTSSSTSHMTQQAVELKQNMELFKTVSSLPDRTTTQKALVTNKDKMLKLEKPSDSWSDF
ncbi:methyl-accepting chemotaxis protein [Thiomicrorhabdus indica]|uniref:methyl-accepting chemotaxis protein n=1 Tax=Thiomicrorhabdus indica TaxID=2267253 RepID=UPI00102D730F|nr:methyl-accepting chemotaxis protein [Thiomicrorhabdus indica]